MNVEQCKVPANDGLKEAAKNHAAERFRTTRDEFLAEKCRLSYIAGAQWKEKQMMMNKAVNGHVSNIVLHENGDEIHYSVTYPKKKGLYNKGDKVKMIIL